ncbi:cytochrome P450 6B1-like [Odontomachus brunneus]|uniref:cytochrome P450 6B1-like n=1 Tax=Odontomachus brunneus TaxID=486640 RepID=UPI0013F1FAD6|nr:cytochrome P450 6B1-like [Odontomachus brunneus]
MLGIVVILCGLIICLLYYYLTAPYNIWKTFNIPGPPPMPFFGTMKDVILHKTSLKKYLKNLYDIYENTPFVGMFYMREPVLMIKDPEYIKDIFVKDAALFSSRGFFSERNEDIMKHSFFFADGRIAQPIRSKISSILMPSKLKDMYRMMLKIMKLLDNYIEELLSRNGHVINCTDMASKLILDVVGHTILGIEMQNLTKGMTEGNEIVTFSKLKQRETFWGNLTKIIMRKISPRLYNWINNYLFDNVKTSQNLVDFIFNIMKYREEHGIVKSDAISIMMELKQNRKHFAEIMDTDITDEFIASQVYTLIFAAYETSKVTICLTLYELALNQNVQDKLRKEIRDVYERNNNEMDFENINAMPYLKAIIYETLRKYPVADCIQRETSSSYTFKNTNITVQKNQKVLIPLYAIHYDSKIYPQPEIYDPDRFMDQTIQHSTYFLSFGRGPRNCIGERLAVLQIKIALISILRNYKLDVCEKTLLKLTINEMVNKPDVDIFLKMTRIN